MSDIGELYKSADWKNEKHVPAIEVAGPVKKTEIVTISAAVGKEIAHPNTTGHHISWLELYFLPEGSKNPYMLSRFDFVSHGASPRGPDTSEVYTEPSVTAKVKLGGSGKVIATSYCNIHGLWTGSMDLVVE